MPTTSLLKDSFVKTLLRFIGSYGLAIAILTLLLFLVYVGTIEQARLGLYDVQDRYFNSLIFFADVPLLPFDIPFPGVYLLMLLFAINLIVGTLQRIPLKREKLGLLINHFGIIFILLSGVVSHHFSIDGQMTLLPGETSNIFSSYHEWEIAVLGPVEDGQRRQWIIDENFFNDLNRRERTFQADTLPFDLTFAHYNRNALVQPIGPNVQATGEVIDGFFINPQPAAKENEMNLPAMQISLLSSGAPERAILWGNSIRPWTVQVNGELWDIMLRKKQWRTPFNITLKEFRHEYHPGTRMARTYESDIIKTENGHEQEINIRMNEPMRYEGYTFFQASFREFPDGTASSTFAVVKNPSDHWPLIACIIITFGMLIHFGDKLMAHLRRERNLQAQQPSAPPQPTAPSSKPKPSKKNTVEEGASA